MRLRLFAPLVHSKLCGALSIDTSVVMWDGRCAVVSCPLLPVISGRSSTPIIISPFILF